MVVTISDIARRANVSKTTVSRVLNGRPDVDAQTAARVRRLVVELDFVPNATARALAHGRGRCLGLLVPSLDLEWLMELLRGVADEVEAANHTLALHTTANGDASLASFLAQVDARVIDGLVAVVPRELPSLVRLRERGFPIVLIDDRGRAPNFASVWTTDRLGGWQATRHLLSLGREPIGIIVGPAHSAGAQDRWAGYCQALAEAAVAAPPALVADGDWSAASGAAAMARLLERQPTIRSVFATNDLMAFGAIRTLARLGRRVPDDVAVVGFDNIPTADLMTPGLTTVRQPLYDIGRAAVHHVLQVLGGAPSISEPVLLPTTLVVRDSCGARPLAGVAAGKEEAIVQVASQA